MPRYSYKGIYSEESKRMNKLKMTFAGFRHAHILGLYALAQKREDIEIVGAYEADASARKEAAAQGVVFNYPSYEALLSDREVEVVAIGDYYAARGGLAIAALEAGKSVLADKPLCTSLAEWSRIEKLSRENGLTVGLMLDLRDNPNFVTALEEIGRGTLGKINNIVMEGQHPLLYGTRPSWYFEEGKHGGVINDIAIHGIDLARSITGSRVDVVIGAREWNFYAGKVPHFRDSAQFMVKMESGAGVIGDVSYAVPEAHGYTLPAYWQFRVWGEKGMMMWSAVSDGVMLYPRGEEARRLAGKMPEEDYLDRFLRAVRGKEAAFTETTLGAARDTLRVEEAARE